MKLQFERSCNPLAGIEVFHTQRCKHIVSGTEPASCNPLAGIEVFHTSGNF